MLFPMLTSGGNKVDLKWAKEFCLCALLAMIVLAAFSRGFGSEFVFDSVVIVDGDPRVDEFNAGSIHDILCENYWWPSMQSNAYRPVATFLFLVQRAVLGFGSSPGSYQLLNLFLHIAVVVAAFKLLVRLQLAPVWAFWASAWFSVHPYVTEVVPNVVGLLDILAFGAVIAGFDVYLRMLDRAIRPIPGLLLFSLITVLGMLSKESAISLLALVFWHGVTLGRERIGDLVRVSPINRGRMIFVAVICGLSILTVIIVPRLVFKNFDMGEGNDMIILDNPLRGETPLVARLNAFSIFGGNMLNCIVPTTISSDYSFGQIQMGAVPPREAWDWIVLARASGVLLFGLSGLLLIFRWPVFSFAVGSVFIMAAPTANFIILIGTIRADRLIYPVILPVLLCVGIVVSALFKRLKGVDVTLSSSPRSPFLRPQFMAAAFCGFFVCLLGLLTNFRATDWRTAAGFWDAAYQTSPNSFKTKLGAASVDREPDLNRINLDIALARAALDQLQDSPHEVVREADLAMEVYAASLIKRVRFQEGKVPRESVIADADEALSFYLRLLNVRIEMDRHASDRLVEKGGASPTERVKKDTVLASIAEIYRFKGEVEKGIELLGPYKEECYLSPKYLLASARLYVDAGDYHTGLKYYVTGALLQPDDVAIAAEADWVLKNKKLPPYAQPYASKESRLKTGAMNARLNLDDPVLVDVVQASLKDLVAWMDRKGDVALKSLVMRRVRVFMGE